MKYKILLLVFIVLLAAFLRLWQLGGVPLSLDWDEAALGYNGYSILHTGRDEYGALLPIVLRSFGDYKPALYAYLTIPFTAVLGLNEIAVRLPSAIAGVLAVLITYLLVEELFGKWEVGSGKHDSEVGGGKLDHDTQGDKKVHNSQFIVHSFSIALLASFLLAISPWHIQFSRIAFEANVGLTLNLAGILFFLKGLKKSWILTLSAASFGLSLYAYQSEKLFVPLILLILIGLFCKKLFLDLKKYAAVALVVLVLVSLPMLLFIITNKNALARAQGVSFLSYKTALLQMDIANLDRDAKNHDFLGFILDNRRVVYGKTILASYLAHYDLNWLFFEGDTISRHHAPNMGLLYVFELPFLLIGIFCLLVNNPLPMQRKKKWLLFLWFLAAPIPASVTTGVPHAVRTLNFLPTFQIFIAFGIINAFLFVKKYQEASIKKQAIAFVLYFIFLLFASLNLIYYLDQYFVQQNYYNAKDWQYGFKQLVAFLTPIQGNYKQIIVSNKGDFDESYMFFLFYTKYDPKKYLAEGGTRVDGVETVGNTFANFEFRKFDAYQENDTPLLLVGSPKDFPENFNKIHEIVYPDKTYAMYVVEKK